MHALYRTGDLARWRTDGDLELPRPARSAGQDPRLSHRARRDRSSAAQPSRSARSSGIGAGGGPGDSAWSAYIVNAESASAAPRWRSTLLPQGAAARIHDSVGFHVSGALAANAQRQVGPQSPARARSGRAPSRDESFAAPRTPTERELARIWSQVLRVDEVGIHDNFFDLGGHSLLATQVISRINDTFPVKLPLRRIFETPTVAGLAEAL